MSAPSASNSTVPMLWLGYCWHQSETSTCSEPVIVSPAARRRDSRPLATHPSSVKPGGVGHGSESPVPPHRGAVPPGPASYV